MLLHPTIQTLVHQGGFVCLALDRGLRSNVLLDRHVYMTECEVRGASNARINDLFLQCIHVVGSSPTPNPTILEHIPIGF